MRKTKVAALFLSLFFVLGHINVGFSADFPKKPIRMIITYGPGGGTDIQARAFQKSFEKELGTKINIEYMPGGSSKVGTMEVMKAIPDGYTIVLMSDMAWVGFYYSKTYDIRVWEKLTPIANILTQPYGFIEVRVESPYKTWGDLGKAAKENPGKMTCGAGTGVGGVQWFVMNDVIKAAGIDIRYVPFVGAGQSNIALLGGHVDFRICQAPEAITMIRAGKTRGLCVNSDKRLKALPDVPTFKELGLVKEGLTYSTTIWGPPNMPQDIVDILTKAIERGTQNPDFIKLAEDELLYKVEYWPPDKVRENLRNFDKKYGPRMAEAYK